MSVLADVECIGCCEIANDNLSLLSFEQLNFSFPYASLFGHFGNLQYDFKSCISEVDEIKIPY